MDVAMVVSMRCDATATLPAGQYHIPRQLLRFHPLVIHSPNTVYYGLFCVLVQ